jgi:Tol biopolymer transport system component
MAILLDRHYLAPFTNRGTLAQMPLGGGAPRELLENVEHADWAPDGQTLAVVHFVAGRNRLEFPIGKVLYETAGWISHPRISPTGDLVAFLEHQAQWDDRGWVSVVDLSGNKKTLSGEWSAEEGLAWSADGDEIWFTAARAGEPFSLRAVTRSGYERVIGRSPTDLMVHDIAPDGRVLLSVVQYSSDVIGLGPGETRERNLSWLDNVRIRDISSDGKTFVFSHFGTGSGPNYTVYLRRTDGSPPIKLGEGAAWALSPDGKWVLAILSTPPQLVLLPTGPGTMRRVDRAGIDVYGLGASWHPDGERVLFNGRESGHAMRSYIQPIESGPPRPITPEGTTGVLVSPDGRRVVAQDAQRRHLLYPVEGNDGPHEIPTLSEESDVLRWASDNRSLYVSRSHELPTQIFRLDLVTGQQELVRELEPADPAGALGPLRISLSADGRWYVYSLTRTLTSLFTGEGLH